MPASGGHPMFFISNVWKYIEAAKKYGLIVTRNQQLLAGICADTVGQKKSTSCEIIKI